jgi:hypothetical protein
MLELISSINVRKQHHLLHLNVVVMIVERTLGPWFTCKEENKISSTAPHLKEVHHIQFLHLKKYGPIQGGCPRYKELFISFVANSPRAHLLRH